MTEQHVKLAVFKVDIDDVGLTYYDHALYCDGTDNDKIKIQNVESDLRFVAWYTENELEQMTRHTDSYFYL